MTLRETLGEIYARKGLPTADGYQELTERAITVLEHESDSIRPHDQSGLPGGLLRLKGNLPTLILPDLHARTGFFLDVMDWRFAKTGTVLEGLESDSLQVLCLGDGFHSEKRGEFRWHDAFLEFSHGYTKHRSMDAEMRESFGVMEMVMECKRSFHDNFHFLKGNHENILNEEGHGNHPFRKFSYEGDMVKEWVLRFYGNGFLDTYALFERSLPLFAIGPRFLASHAEPSAVYGEDELIGTRTRPDVISGLTWTDNGGAPDGTVQSLLDRYLPGLENAVYFGGHRAVTGQYRYRAGNKYLQIHNPEMQNTALVMPDREFDPETDLWIIPKGERRG